MATPRPIALREILAATDFSSHSMQAVDAATALAQHFGARLHVIHVVTHASEKNMAEGRLDALSPMEPLSIGILKVAPVGQPASEIVKYAEREKIDLIVLGTHGRSGLARVLMGSVAEAVVRTSPCQVLTIGPKAKAGTQAAEPAAPAASPIPASHCLICAKPSSETICDSCKAHIQGEAIQRKRREERT